MIKQQHFLTTWLPNIWLGLWDGVCRLDPCVLNLFEDIFTLFFFSLLNVVLISFWVLNALH